MKLAQLMEELSDKEKAKVQGAEISKLYFAKAVADGVENRYNSALENYTQAIKNEPEQTFYYINRGALQAEMIDFISSMENNVQILTLENTGAARARVK